jgi:hypothetical protein
MSVEQRRAAAYFAEKVSSLNEKLVDPSLVSPQVLANWDLVVDEIMKRAEVDYAYCLTDNQSLAVIAVITSALDLRARLRGSHSKPLSDLNDFLINAAAGKPTRLKLPQKAPGSTKPINRAQGEVFYVVLYKSFPTQSATLNAEARASFSLTNDGLRKKRYDLDRQRTHDKQVDRMFQYAEAEVAQLNSSKLADYI